MAIELSDSTCPECGHRLQVIYASTRKQVVTGWACPDCGLVASEKEGFQGKISDDEVWMLVDPADGSLVDILAGGEESKDR